MRSRIGCLALAALMIGTLLLSACSTPTSSPVASPAAGTTSSGSTPTPAVKKPSGSLTISMGFRYNTIDPQRGSSPNTFQAVGAGIWDSLVELTPTAAARPGIAERWEISKDGMSHTFYIRKGVKFHDGSDLTGEDVKYSLERAIVPENTASVAGIFRKVVAKVELKDPYTVVIQRTSPLFELDPEVTNLQGLTAIVPKKYIESKGEAYFESHPMGSGPFKVLNYVPGGQLDLEAIENHWRAVPEFKNIKIINVSEEASKIAMLKTGELDIAQIAPDSAPQLKAAGLQMVVHDGGAQYYMALYHDLNNPDKYALGSLKVRQAMSQAINRKELSDKLYGGYASPSAFFYAPASAYFFDTNVLKPDPYDPEGAKRLLASAGYPSFRMKLWDLGGGGQLTMFNQALLGYWRAIGVSAELTPIDQAALTAMYRPVQTPPLWDTIRTTLTGGGVFQFEKMAQVYHSKISSMRALAIPELDDLIDLVPMTADPAEKKRLALKAAVMARDSYTLIPILDMYTVYATSGKVGKFVPINNIVDLAASMETITRK